MFDGIRTSFRADRSQFFKDLTVPFYGANRAGSKVTDGMKEAFWRVGMQGAMKGEYECIEQFPETDFTADLKTMDVPTLVIHGDDDQIVPIGAAGLRCAKFVPNGTLKIFEGAPHGLPSAHREQLNAELLASLRING